MLPLRWWVAWSSSKDDKCTHTPRKKREHHKIARWRTKFDRSLILCENNPIDKIDTIKFNISWSLQIIKALSLKCCVPFSRDQSGSKVSETSRVFILLETFIDIWRVMSGILEQRYRQISAAPAFTISLKIFLVLITDIFIRFSTLNIAFMVFWLVRSTPVISSYSQSTFTEMHWANCCGAWKKLQVSKRSGFNRI